MNASDYPFPPSVEILYCDHHDWLHGWLRRRLGNAADASDLAHDAFLRLILKPASRGFDSFGEARAYLRAMAQGMCINLWHRREIEQAWLDTLAARPEEYAPSAEHQAIVLEALHEIGAMLLDLPPKAARAFLMAAACQMTDKEVAEELGVSTRMVRKYVAQAMLCCLRSQARQTLDDLSAGGRA
ncbi:sigma-70 family RNA polymerase sigma factor [Pseudothauera rhizosphaerae]|uniref:Sigma-70 family RNA polymerase sigma factor n=1 Tax=Pseudothauera rhizosphaerae TaxID=2565932 RepID=A0A4S4AVF8_9RHOO|nr:sigma-70 family RNA polymerase sigma factor [Pseudothauera rhizosphaerae]THF62526.1 sigma-70 family RNA polymerase sigma factor [Pseudothauera rhizosphaerae]